MNSLKTLARCAFLGTAVLIFVTSTFAAQFYATPAGAGSANGTSWANAWPQAQIQTAITNLAAGDTLNLGSGTYTLSTLSIAGSGTSGSLIRITGADTGAGLPVFQGAYVVGSGSGGTFLSVPADASYWTISNLVLKNHRFAVRMAQSGTTYNLRANLTFENIACDSVEDGFGFFNAENVTVRNCSVIRHTKKAFRIGHYSRFITYDSCHADCNGGDDGFPAASIPNGFYGNDTGGAAIIHDITFVDCTARNNRFVQASGSYWNGDGFSSEEGTYNLTFLRCKSYDNHDGGYDHKADNITMQDCIAAGNKRGFRFWRAGVSLDNCLSVNNASWGGTGGVVALWVSGSGGAVTADFSTFHNATATLIELESGGSATIRDSILSVGSGSAAFTAGSVTLTNTATYRPGSGSNPSYVAPSSSWRGAPANAYDSQTYGTTKGYSSTIVGGGDTTSPSVPAGLAASSITSTSFTLSWNAATDNVGVTGYEVFRNGVSYATPTGTSVSVTGLSPGTTYGMRVRARDAAGNWSAQSTTLNVTTAAAPAIRIEAGSNATYTDVSSNVWAADQSFTGGSSIDRGAIAIANTTDDRIYQTERWGLTGYAIAVANGTYTVRLHFAETYTAITAAGQRVFSVTAEGASPAGWSNIDLFAQAGGRNIALIKTANITVADGVLNLGFAASVENTIINGIEVLPVMADTTPPTVPTGLASSNITSTSFTLSWSASTDTVGVTGYEVFRNGVSYATPAGTSVSVTGLAANTTYSMTVRARDAAGNWSAQSAALNVTTAATSDTTAPSVPTGLAASSITSTAFTLAWNAATDNVGVTGYEVFRNGVSYATPTGTSVSVTGLTAGTTYSMRVRARDAAGNWSAQSTALNVTTAAATAPMRIEAGSTASFTDTSSNVWAADHSHTGGGIVDRGAIAIANTTDDRIYQTERWGLTGYAITVPNGTYTVRLHLAETYTPITGSGQRIFSVTAEGASPAGWSNIDVYTQAGGRNIALIKSASVTVLDGVLNLGFTASVQSTIINGIEVTPGTP